MPDRKPKPDRPTPRKEKLCKTCKRPFHWTEQNSRDWDILKYCSEACSGHRAGEAGEKDAALETAILLLLAERGPNKTICPSQAAKLVAGRTPQQIPRRPPGLGSPDGTRPLRRTPPRRPRQHRHHPAQPPGRPLHCKRSLPLTTSLRSCTFLQPKISPLLFNSSKPPRKTT
jgi:hypothetical protein